MLIKLIGKSPIRVHWLDRGVRIEGAVSYSFLHFNQKASTINNTLIYLDHQISKIIHWESPLHSLLSANKNSHLSGYTLKHFRIHVSERIRTLKSRQTQLKNDGKFVKSPFLVVSHNYTRVCPSVGRSIRRSVGRSVRRSVRLFKIFWWQAETKTASNLCRVSGLVLLVFTPKDG